MTKMIVDLSKPKGEQVSFREPTAKEIADQEALLASPEYQAKLAEEAVLRERSAAWAIIRERLIDEELAKG